MARAFGEVVVQDIHGEFKSGVQVDLIDPATGVRILDTVFADATSAVTLSLPLVTNQYGRAPFYLGAGKLVIGRVTLAGVAYDDLIPVADPTATGGGSTGGAIPSHTHIEADVTGLPPDLAAKAPVAHAHVETDVTNLPTDLAAKAPAAHVHPETEVTNLPGDLGATEKTANKGVANGYAGLDNTNLILTARLGTGTADATTYHRGDRTWQKLPVTVIAASLHNPAGITTGVYFLPRIPASRAGTTLKIQARAAGGTSAAFNIRKNGTFNLLAADLTVTSGATFAVSTTLQNAAFATDDYPDLMLNTVTGTVTDLEVQIEIQ